MKKASTYYLRQSFLFCLIVFIIISCQPNRKKAETNQPNIVIILADDMGYSDIGSYGGEVNTPNLDRLASEGLRFTQFYNAARCCPTRASLLTGIYPHESGMGHMVNSNPNETNPVYLGHLNDKCVTIAEVLKSAGYYTAMSGKWHVGEEQPNWPTNRGFDNYYGLISGAANYWDISRTKKEGIKRHFAIDSTEYMPPNKGFYMTDAITENALKYIGKAGEKQQPFFLYVAYTAPHWPLHAWPEDIKKYKGKFIVGWDSLRIARFEKMAKMRVIGDELKLSPRDSEVSAWESLPQEQKEHMDLLMAIYAAQIDRMDQGIGEIMDALDGINATDNTLVLFLSDNGGCHEGGPIGQQFWETSGDPGTVDSYLSYGRSWANLSNTPFRMFKHWVHEGGISTPLIARWPEKLTDRGGLTNQPGHIVDIMATCCDIAGTNYPEEFRNKPVSPLRGKSLLPIFEGNIREPHNLLFWEHEGNKAVRMGHWKLVSKDAGKWELYNLKSDRTELVNLALSEPDTLKNLANRYNEWAENLGILQ